MIRMYYMLVYLLGSTCRVFLVLESLWNKHLLGRFVSLCFLVWYTGVAVAVFALARNLRHVMVPYEDEWREAGQWSQSQAGWHRVWWLSLLHLCIVCMKFFESDICQWKTWFLWCFRLRKDLFVGEDSFFRQVLLSCRWSSGYSFCEVLPLRMAWDGVEAQLLYQNTSTKQKKNLWKTILPGFKN